MGGVRTQGESYFASFYDDPLGMLTITCIWGFVGWVGRYRHVNDSHGTCRGLVKQRNFSVSYRSAPFHLLHRITIRVQIQNRKFSLTSNFGEETSSFKLWILLMC